MFEWIRQIQKIYVLHTHIVFLLSYVFTYHQNRLERHQVANPGVNLEVFSFLFGKAQCNISARWSAGRHYTASIFHFLSLYSDQKLTYGTCGTHQYLPECYAALEMLPADHKW